VGDYSEEDARDADRIAARLLEGEPPRELEAGFSIEDVDTDAIEFVADLAVVDAVGRKVPAMEVAGGPPVPVSLSLILRGLPGDVRHLYRYDRYWYEVAHRVLRDESPALSEPGFTRLDVGEARESFRFRVVDFLANRLAAVRRRRTDGARGEDHLPETQATLQLPQYRGGPVSSVPGCHFSVVTRSSGLTAYWSGAYYISRNYHAAPTSPAKAPLQAGTYIFGVDGGAYGNRIRWGRNQICTLPGNPSVTLPF